MLLLLATLFACSVEPATVAEKGGRSSDAATPANDAEIPLLGVKVEDPPRSIAGLRADPSAPGDFVLDGSVFAWSGPPVRDGRVRYDGNRQLKRAVLNVVGRPGCEALVKHVEAVYGPPSVAGCTERQWQTPTHSLRYQERPEKANCAISVLVGDGFDLPAPPVAALADASWGGVKLGTPPEGIAGLAPIGSDGTDQLFTGPGPELGDVPTHGIEYRFLAGRLGEVSVRAHGSGCDALRDELVATFGPGGAGSGSDLDWQSCEAAVEYRYSATFQACRAMIASPELRWRHAETASADGDPDLRVAQNEIARFVVDDGGRLVITSGISDWLDAHPEFATGPSREPIGREGEPSGIRLAGVRRDSVEFALGLRDGDVIVAIDGKPPEDYRPAADVRTLDLTVRRAGEDQAIRIGFDEGVYARIGAVRPTFP